MRSLRIVSLISVGLLVGVLLAACSSDAPSSSVQTDRTSAAGAARSRTSDTVSTEAPNALAPDANQDASTPRAITPTSTTMPTRTASATEELATVPTTVALSESRAQQEIANTGGAGVNLRVEPSLVAAIVTLLRDGDLVLLLGPEDERDGLVWRNVQDSAGSTGWVAAQFLVEPGTAATAEPPLEAMPEATLQGDIASEDSGDAPTAVAPTQFTAVYFAPELSCPGCAERIEASARAVAGVVEVTIDVDRQYVTVAFDADLTDAWQIAAAIEAGGDAVILCAC